MIESLSQYYQSLSIFGKTAITLNIVLLFLAPIIFNYLVPSDKTNINGKRIRHLRLINMVLLSVYFFDWLINYQWGTRASHSDIFIKISQTGLVCVLGYLFTQFSHTWTIKAFGKERTVEGETIKSRTYQSEMGYIVILLGSIIVSLLLLINIWEVTAWLQATGVIGGLLVILFGTKEAWAHDAVSGLVLLYNGDIAPGVVCRIKSLDVFAVVRRMTLTETTFYDVIQKHSIIVSNRLLRAHPIEVLNKVDSRAWNDYVNFKIGYDTPSEHVEAFITEVWQRACQLEKYLDPEKTPKLVLYNPGDHAIEWRMNYRIESVYRIKPARYAINRAAFDLQSTHKLSLATPITWANQTTNQPEQHTKIIDP